jgi:8-oxo-dGTP pyrophosphatase MutT (NUDIX family)
MLEIIHHSGKLARAYHTMPLDLPGRSPYIHIFMETFEMGMSERKSRVQRNVMATLPQDAAMLVLLRDRPGAGTKPEVLLVKRRADRGFEAGAYSFPGGVLEPTDCLPAALALSPGVTDTEAGWRMPDVEPSSRALGFWIAALRQTFAEADLLLARYGDGRLWEPSANDLRTLVWQRRAWQQGHTNFPNMMHELERWLATDLLVYFAHGMTPDALSPRFSTRCFLTRVPSGVSALPETSLAVEQIWLTAEAALQRRASGDLQLTDMAANIIQLLESFPHAEGAMSHYLRLQHVEML